MNRLSNRFTLIIGCALLGALLAWLSFTAARADLNTAAAPTTQSSGGSADSRTQPAARSQPIDAAASLASDHTQPMPRAYMVLLNHSMFVRGHAAEAGHVGQHFAGPSTMPSVDRSETGLVFNGVTKTADKIDALIEDTSSGRVLTVHVGDAIAKGTVKSITFDTLEYESDGKVIEVHIGQNLTGNNVDVSAVPTTSAPAGSGASPQDILERLRLKRLQELGGGPR
jgi:hypothetical protein